MSTFDEKELTSFWAHYNAATAWIKIHDEARTAALRDYEWKRAEKEVDSMLNLDDDVMVIDNENPPGTSALENVEYTPDADEEEEEEMTQEMRDFFRISMEHRKEREAKRLQEQEEQTGKTGWIQLEQDVEFVLANHVGVFGVQKQSTETPNAKKEVEERRQRLRLTYGADADKISAMETLVDFRFNEHFDKHKPHLWPNIPLRF
ncbi:hypothetical protein AAVH_02561 [Aphelenchoides avenae]|nr:hypothetical protein AAVH_02561 [Aphelenchus avenae]